MVVLDEAGTTDDTTLAHLAAHVEAARAKLVIVGDHHQLGPVGPRGALAALVTRYPDAVHRLTENRRQADPEERRALAGLREGDVGEAVAFYTAEGRIHPVPDREEALQAAVEGWAADAAGGAEVGLYAWRRANVTELNSRARAWMAGSGRLSGPEVACLGGNAYRAGDHVVALAPGPEGSLVTSQRAVVTAVDPDAGTVSLLTSDGRQVRLVGDEADAGRLGYGYATTVHRAQGETVDRAHLFADSGGRELAYVAMSRARQTTQIWTVADDVDQAGEDLARDWANRRTPIWALDTGLPTLDQLTPQSGAALAEARIATLAHAKRPSPATPSPGPQPRNLRGPGRRPGRPGRRPAPAGRPGASHRHLRRHRSRPGHRRPGWRPPGARRRPLDGRARAAAPGPARCRQGSSGWGVGRGRRRPALGGPRGSRGRPPRGAHQPTGANAGPPDLTTGDERRAQATRRVVEAGFEHQRAAKQLDRRLDAHRNHLDRIERAAPGSARHDRRAATEPEQYQTPPDPQVGPEL